MVRTRIAASPTGFPHIGTIYQAIFDYALAKKYDGQFIVRVEDTDRARLVEGAEAAILDSLEWFQLPPDEGPQNPNEEIAPYRQSERKEKGIYNEYIEILLNKPLPKELLENTTLDEKSQAYFCAYYCFCTKERLTQLRLEQQARKQLSRYDKHCTSLSREEAEKRAKTESYVVRLNVPKDSPIKFSDWLVGDVEVTSNDVDDQVLLKADGYPTYHLAVVVDDYLMKITHIFRGKEWLSSTPKHIILYYYFGWTRPIYIHLPLILNMDGKGKLSKRHGHASVNYYREEGFLPQAITNYLINIVWHHPEGKEIFSLSEFIEKLHINKIEGAVRTYANVTDGIKEILSLDENHEKFITSQGPRFDLDKLLWINGIYIREELTVQELAKQLKLFITDEAVKENHFYKDEKTFEAIVTLAQERIATLKQFNEVAGHFFQTPPVSTEYRELSEELATKLSGIANEDWQKEAIFSIIKEIMVKDKLKMPVFYKIFTGKERGLPLPETLVILGKEKTLARLQTEK